MSTENKTPREFWIAPKLIHPCDPVEPSYFYAYDEPGDPAQLEIHVREVLPETDGVWVSRDQMEKIKRSLKVGHKGLDGAFDYGGFPTECLEALRMIQEIERGGGK